MCRRTLSVLAVVTTAAWLAARAPGVAGAQPAGLSNNQFPPSFYGFNPGYYGPYYPGQYRYGNVDPAIYNNYTYPRFSGYDRGYQPGYGALNTVPLPSGSQPYSSPSGGASSSRYLPPAGSYGYRVPSTSPPVRSAPAREDTAVLAEVRLPMPDAELWVEGRKTASTGTRRRFFSPPLIPGERYLYEFRARWFENGREVLRTRNVPVRAGERITVDFTTPPRDEAESASSSHTG